MPSLDYENVNSNPDPESFHYQYSNKYVNEAEGEDLRKVTKTISSALLLPVTTEDSPTQMKPDCDLCQKIRLCIKILQNGSQSFLIL